MRRLFLEISYDGTAYGGYQVQKNALTVAEVMQDAIEGIFGKRLPIIGCSRTDSGVHANGFCLTFDIENGIPIDRVPIALNAKLPGDIVVKDCRETDESFHPRYSALGKRYLYRLYTAKLPSPFLRNHAYHYPFALDLSKMQEGAKNFLGRHDYKGFSNAGGKVINTTRTITKCELFRCGDEVIIVVEGDGFLYNMVRIMVGSLVDIGSGFLPIESIIQVLKEGNRRKAGRTAPAHGLYLDQVFYEEKDGKLLPGRYNMKEF